MSANSAARDGLMGSADCDRRDWARAVYAAASSSPPASSKFKNTSQSQNPPWRLKYEIDCST